MTARDTGAAALAALALKYQHTPPKDAMQHVLGMFDGNATATARDLSVGKKSLMAAVTALGLDGWLAATWPHRARGGQGARLGRAPRGYSTSTAGRNYVLHLKAGERTLCGRVSAAVNCAAGEEPDDALCQRCLGQNVKP